ncbi:MAG: hypothetical protein UEA60_10265 [Lachnospiraceae bacterium]|nr:hypothetical protein [Lachnospiraceae bacterium]
MNIKYIDNDKLNITEERKREIDNILNRKMIFAISDIHGNLHAMKKAVDQIRPYLVNGN